jgi:hypothetical protein
VVTGPVGRVGHFAGVLAIGLILVAAATLVDGWVPADPDQRVEEPFVTRGEVGERLDLREVSVEVDAVRGASSIDVYGSPRTSPGVWVVVEYSVVPRDETTGLQYAELRDGRGRVWVGSHGRNQAVCLDGPPGVRSGCVAWFEVPVDAVPDLRLRLAPTLEQRFDAIAEVDLGLTGADVDEFLLDTGLEIPGTSVGEVR